MAKRKSSNPRFEGERITNLVSPVSGLRIRFVEWYNPAIGQKRKVECEFQVQVQGEWATLCRYDGAHGIFHRHRAAWPKPLKRDADFADVPMKRRGAAALEDVKQHAREWLALIPKEVIDGEATA